MGCAFWAIKIGLLAVVHHRKGWVGPRGFRCSVTSWVLPTSLSHYDNSGYRIMFTTILGQKTVCTHKTINNCER